MNETRVKFSTILNQSGKFNDENNKIKKWKIMLNFNFKKLDIFKGLQKNHIVFFISKLLNQAFDSIQNN